MPKITTDLKTAVIKKGDAYVKVQTNNYTLVNSIMYATVFTVADAEEFIQNRIKKPLRSQFVVEPVVTKNGKAAAVDYAGVEDTLAQANDVMGCMSGQCNTEEVKAEVVKAEVVTSLQGVKKVMINELIETQHKYMEKLRYYNNVILDIRHYIRDYNTNLDTEQAAQVLYRLQQVERDRANIKRELRRISTVFNSIDNAIAEADKYEYEPYKPRVIVDMYNFLERGV